MNPSLRLFFMVVIAAFFIMPILSYASPAVMATGDIPVQGIDSPIFPSDQWNRAYKIVGGDPVVSIEPWPWMTALFYTSVYDETVNKYEFFCGGSLVGPQWVVTAAHCVYDIILPQHIRAVVGMADISSIPADAVMDIDAIYVHPWFGDYRLRTPYSDIALLHLTKPIEEKYVPLYRGDDTLSGMTALALGWGSQCGYGSGDLCTYSPDRLSEVELPIIDNKTCSEASATFGVPPVDSSEICAGDGMGGKDTCSGDSGGPLLVEINGRWILAGITSYGMIEECGTPGSYGVYSRVSALTEFIDFYTGCVPVSKNLTLDMPCLEYQGAQYAAEFIWNSSADGEKKGGWTVALDSVRPVEDYDGACVVVNNDLHIPVCAEYDNYFYRFEIAPSVPANGDEGVLWQIDYSTFTIDASYTP